MLMFRSICLLVGVSCSTIAHAQVMETETDSPAVATDGSNEGIEDIVVTANRRETRLQDVPISVTAVGGEQLSSSGITNPVQLPQVVPGLNIVRQATNIQAVIRGVGTSSNNQGDESNVAIYVDGVYVADQTASFSDFPDVERVEVLRGPQGTLFGRNATGGLIQIITKDPKFNPEGSVELSYGNFNSLSIKAFGTAPISDTLAFSLSGFSTRGSGWVRDLLNGNTVGENHQEAVRGKLLFEPSDSSRIKLTVSQEFMDDASQFQQFAVDGNTVGRSIDPTATIATGPYTTAQNGPIFMKKKATRADLQTHFDLGGVALETTASYSRSVASYQSDIDRSPVAVAEAGGTNYTNTFTGEIRLLSVNESSIEWILGAYAFYSKGSGPTLVGAPAISDANLIDVYPNARAKSFALFGEGTYHVTDRLDLILGGRLTYEKRLFSQVSNGVLVIDDASIADTRFTPRVSAQYEINNATNVYATYSTGFKSGGFNTISTSDVAVQPETLTAYEVGFKSDLAPWLRINASAYYYDYKNLQVIAREGTSGLSTLQNAATARIKGGELELTIKPTYGLTVRGAAAYTDAQYQSFTGATNSTPTLDVNGVPVGGNSTFPVDVSGNQLVRTPKFTLNGAVDYVTDVSFGRVGATMNAYYSSKVYWNTANSVFQPGYVRINGEIFVEPSENLRFSAWMRNATDSEVAGEIVVSGSGTFRVNMPPRQYGVTARMTF